LGRSGRKIAFLHERLQLQDQPVARRDADGSGPRIHDAGTGADEAVSGGSLCALIDVRSAPTPIDTRANGHESADDRSRGSLQSPTATSRSRSELAGELTASLQANTTLNRRVRGGLGVFALVCAVSALAYTWALGDQLVRRGTGVEDVLALLLPVGLFVLLGVLAAAGTYVAHARSLEESYRTLEALNRIEREGEVAVSARGLIFAFEEKLHNARRAFTLQLWLGRMMFLVCLGLLAATLVSAMIKDNELATVATGAGSLVAALLGVTKRVPHNVGRHLADVVQIQSIITGCDRQISLLESSALAVLKTEPPTDATQAFVFEAQTRIDEVVDHAVRRIEEFADPANEQAP
jgi:hypothetical protein